MSTLLTESDLLTALTQRQLESIRSQAPAGEDPVALNMVHAALTVDGFVKNRSVPTALATRWARDIAVFDLAKILDKPTDAQTKAYESAMKCLEAVSHNLVFPASKLESAPLSWGSKKKF